MTIVTSQDCRAKQLWSKTTTRYKAAQPHTANPITKPQFSAEGRNRHFHYPRGLLKYPSKQIHY
ncbi:hypothetical protein VIAQ111709_10020 [Vibrio aquimaris]|uniref:Uncharacterized protein n=1 Tax=Vibrio aquimaris TaxID=2587862 RepID=A0A5P9CKY6_9VIBR|nr:hypothetical protein FIV01_09545 [Vibrio aquimaris]